MFECEFHHFLLSEICHEYRDQKPQICKDTRSNFRNSTPVVRTDDCNNIRDGHQHCVDYQTRIAFRIEYVHVHPRRSDLKNYRTREVQGKSSFPQKHTQQMTQNTRYMMNSQHCSQLDPIKIHNHICQEKIHVHPTERILSRNPTSFRNSLSKLCQ